MNKLKQKIIEVVPEIIELKFGCKILEKRENNFGDVIWTNHIILGEYYNFNHNGIYEYSVIPNLCFNVEHEEWRLPADEIQERIDDGELKILGRPIRLADVLLAIGKECMDIKKYGDVGLSWGVKGELLIINETTNSRYEWNLKDDNLDNQSKETIKFLEDLLL